MNRWHEREKFPPCGQRTTKSVLCVRPARWLLMKDEHPVHACTAHATILMRQGWVRVSAPPFKCFME